MGRKKIQYEEIKAFIEGPEGNGCKLLTAKEEYEGNGMNTLSKLEIKCKCGETFKTSFDKFKNKNQRQCKECGIKKIGEANKGKKRTEESKRKMSEARKGKKHSEETRKKISDAHKGEKHTEESKKKMSKAHKGKTLSEETKNKMSKSRKGKNNPMYGKHRTEETRKKISEARKGKKHSEETRKKISDAHKGENNNNWKGGITSIANHLRECIKPWNKDSTKYSDYKSVISGKPFDHIHHVNKNFSEIVELTFKISNIEIKETIVEYTSEELEKLEKICLMLHYFFGPGVCLTEEEHKLFHSLYGKHDNTKEQFEEFKNKLKKIQQ